MMKLNTLVIFSMAVACAVVQAAEKNINDYFNAIVSDKHSQKTIEDTKNGYIKYSSPDREGYGELSLWRWTGGKVLLGKASVACGPQCVMEEAPVFYLFDENNKHIVVTDQVLPLQEIEAHFKKCEAFMQAGYSVNYAEIRRIKKNIEFNQIIRQVNRKVFINEAERWFKLPRKGQLLQVGFDVGQQGEGPYKFIPIMDLSPQGGRFVVTKKYELADFKSLESLLLLGLKTDNN